MVQSGWVNGESGSEGVCKWPEVIFVDALAYLLQVSLFATRCLLLEVRIVISKTTSISIVGGYFGSAECHWQSL